MKWTLIIVLFFVSAKEIQKAYEAKKMYLAYKQPIILKENIKHLEKEFIKTDTVVSEVKIKKQNKKINKININKEIEPKKIAEPVQLPEPVVVKIDTPKFKSYIKVTKTP